MLNLSKGPLPLGGSQGAFFLGVTLRFIHFPVDLSHTGLIYETIVPVYWWRIFNGVLSSVHLIEFYFLRPRFWWLLCLNPVSIFLVNCEGDLFWIFEGGILFILLAKKRYWKLAALTAFFTGALVFL